MKDFVVTVDGRYLYVGIMDKYKDALETFPLIPEYLESGVESFLGLFDVNFDPADYNFVFDDNTGRLNAFGSYFAVYSSTYKRFVGYSKIADFWETAKPKPNSSGFTSTTGRTKDLRYYRDYNSNTPLVPKLNIVYPESGDRIFFAKREIIEVNNEYKIKVTSRFFIYPDASSSDANELARYEEVKHGLHYSVDEGLDRSKQTINDQDFFTFMLADPEVVTYENLKSDPDIKNYVERIKGKGFKRENGNRNLTSFEVDIVESVAFTFNALFNNTQFVNDISPASPNLNLKYIFDQHFAIINDTTNFWISQEEYDKYYNLRYFQELRVRLLEFYHVMALGRWWYLYDKRTYVAAWLYGLFKAPTLKTIPYLSKVELLNHILIENDFINGRWNPLIFENKFTREELIIGIVDSFYYKDENDVINYNEINDFVDLLNSYVTWNSNDQITLYQVLYDSIDFDVFFDDGKGAKGQLVSAIYRLWKNSKYNPTSNQSNLVSYNYTNYDAIWDYENTQEFDTNASPYILPYESKRVAIFLADNFNFSFDKNKIIANWLYLNSNDRVTYGILVEAFSSFFKKEIPYGYYDIFQPIGIVNVNTQSTAISLPVDPEELTNVNSPCDLSEVNNIPLFYLKYVDDLGDRQDGEATLFASIDVVSTFIGGWGIVRNLMANGGKILIRSLFVTTNPTITAAARTSLMRALRRLSIPTLEFILGAASTAHAISTGNCSLYNDCTSAPPGPNSSNYEAYQRCQAIEKWLLALELLTLTGDLSSHRFFKESTRDLNNKLPDAGNNPFNNIADTDYDSFKNKIYGLDDIEADFLNFQTQLINDGYNSISSQLSQLTIENKKYAFMFDFINDNDEVLNFLESNPIAFNKWNDFYDLDIPNRSLLFATKNEELLTGFVRFYQQPLLTDALNALSYEKRLKFIEDFKDTDADWLNSLVSKPESIQHWDSLDAAGRSSAKTNPNDWLINYSRLYSRLDYQARLTTQELLNIAGQDAVALENFVETKTLEFINNASPKEIQYAIVGSAMRDKTTGIMNDEIFINFSDTDFRIGGNYETYHNSMFPNLKTKIEKLNNFGVQNYNVDDTKLLGFIRPRHGKESIGSHAEVRALNDLAKKKFNLIDYPNGVTDDVFEAWMKNDVIAYNRNMHLQNPTKIVMHTCAECFYILDLITFLRR